MKNILLQVIYISLTVTVYILSMKLNKKLKNNLLNPILISTAAIILILIAFNIEFTTYYSNVKLIVDSLGPVVVILAVPIYKNRNELKKNMLPIMVGILTSIGVSIASVFLLCKMFKLDDIIITSLIPKSVTSPIAIESTRLLGGNQALTIAAVVITGMVGGTFAPILFKHGKIKSKIALGIGIGTSSHALGTSKAIELDEEMGAASGLAMGLAGLFTIIGIIIYIKFFK